MLLAVSFYLIAMTLPVTVVYAVVLNFGFPEVSPSIDVTSDSTWHRHLTYVTVRAVVQEVGMSHYAGNIFIYLATGKVFRSELRMILGRVFWRPIVAVAGDNSPVYRRHVADVADVKGQLLVSSVV